MVGWEVGRMDTTRSSPAGTDAAEPDLQQHFDGTIARDQRIEPRDWMPEATGRH